MSQNPPTLVIGSKTARCVGDTARSHDAVELVLVGTKVAICPRCGRQFRRADSPGSVSPAAWPKDK